jgi:Fe-S-cluster containining protein
MENTVDINDSPFPRSPVETTQYDGSKVIQFRCHKDIACFNACCKNIDITLTPYDILRLKRRLGMTSGEFLREYTVPFEMEKEGIAGVKFNPVEDGTACRFMRDEGCSVYEDRPTACRYYPVALISMRKQDEYTDVNSYALVKEAHCKGHFEDRSLTIDEYRQEQGLDDYDRLARGWRQLVLKKKSSGPTVGKASKRSLQLFFMACYDLDRFREFIISGPFKDTYEISDEIMKKILNDEIELMLFAFGFLRQVMFGEEFVPMKADALDKHLARKRELAEAQAAAGEHDGNADSL